MCTQLLFLPLTLSRLGFLFSLVYFSFRYLYFFFKVSIEYSPVNIFCKINQIYIYGLNIDFGYSQTIIPLNSTNISFHNNFFMDLSLADNGSL